MYDSLRHASPNSHFCLFKNPFLSIFQSIICPLTDIKISVDLFLMNVFEMMRLRFCRHLEQPRCQQFPWADDGSLSLISARWLTLMDAGHESRPALISARSLTKTPEVEFRGRLSIGLSVKMKMSPRIHSGTSGSCKNEAAQKT